MEKFEVCEMEIMPLQKILQHAVAPRPIAFVSTINAAGHINLSPFSFFNLVSINPPVLAFSVLRRVRDNSTKHTLDNILEVPECVVNLVSYAMVEQMSLSSTEYEADINEFEKSGFTPIPSLHVQPPRVAESTIQMECTVDQVIPISHTPGAGNLVLARVKTIYINPEVMDKDGNLSQAKLDQVARLGANWYSRVLDHNLFEIPKPLASLGIGVDALPDYIVKSGRLNGNELGRLGNIASLPTVAEQAAFEHTPECKVIRSLCASQGSLEPAYQYAGFLLAEGKTEQAWLLLIAAHQG